MYTKTIKYINYDNEEVEKTFHFHINEVEFTELQTSVKGGLKGLIEEIQNSKDESKIVQLYKELILLAYGEKKGEYFKKKDSIRGRYSEDFEASAAFPALFVELAKDTNSMIEFVNGIMPTQLRKELNAQGGLKALAEKELDKT